MTADAAARSHAHAETDRFAGVSEYLTWDHARLDALLAETARLVDLGSCGAARVVYESFEGGLRRHIGLEEKVLFPVFARAPFKQGRVWQAGGDIAGAAPAGAWMITGEAEANYGVFSNEYGRLSVKGGRVQVGVSRGRVGNVVDARLMLQFTF